MSVFEDISRDVLTPALADLHGEAGVYVPQDGDPFPITVIVERGMLQTTATDQNGRLLYKTAVKISMADRPKIVLNGDKLRFKLRLDDSDNKTMTISHVIDQVGGMWHLGLN